MLVEPLGFSKCQGQLLPSKSKASGHPLPLYSNAFNSPKQLPSTAAKFVMPPLSVLGVQWVDRPTELIVRRLYLFICTKQLAQLPVEQNTAVTLQQPST